MKSETPASKIDIFDFYITCPQVPAGIRMPIVCGDNTYKVAIDCDEMVGKTDLIVCVLAKCPGCGHVYCGQLFAEKNLQMMILSSELQVMYPK